ncbi:MAG TPA: phosphoribosylanthranilate isomerase [Gemmatimonadaceae bacterium]|nr:phosphoribosylanthranilate isomerase [Gemmatimonadaceae bacterium]
MTEIKFCGLTRAADARVAAELGAAYVGVVFAGGPRRQDEQSAAPILEAVRRSVGRVGVFGAEPWPEIARRAARLGLRAVQLHADPSVADIRALRAVWQGEVWAALRVSGSELPAHAAALFAAADAVVLDARVEGSLGGTGVALAWKALGGAVGAVRGGRARLVLAGGLRPENVAEAVRALAPDVVDVSSGVESTVGIKDPTRMRAFRDAVRSVEVAQ